MVMQETLKRRVSNKRTFFFLSLHEDISHGFNVTHSFIWPVFSFVPTRVGVIMFSSSSKPDSGVTVTAIVFVVTEDTDSCLGIATAKTHNIEPFLVTVGLQRSFRAYQRLPRGTTQRGGAVLPVSDQ